MTFPDSTFKLGIIGSLLLADDAFAADAAALSMVPVSASFLPTCGVSAAPFAINR